MKEDVGYKFTGENIKTKVSDAGLDNISDGAITGFIHRAVRLGRVRVAGKAAGTNGRMLHQYEIVDREPWEFKPRSKGSPKGRTIGERHYQEVPEPKNETVKVSNYSLQCLFSDRLFMLAVEAAELEKKSLEDYISDELIAELKTRMK